MVDLSSSRASWADRAPFDPEPFDPDTFDRGPFDRAPFEPTPFAPRVIDAETTGPTGPAGSVGSAGPSEPAAPADRPVPRFGFKIAVFSLLTLLMLGGGTYAAVQLVSGPDRSAGKAPAAAPETPAADPATDPAADPAGAAPAVPSETPPAETPTASAPAPPPPAAGTNPGTKPANPGTKPANPGPAGERDEVVRLVNAERARAGCPALATDGRLTASAGAHSADMAAKHYFSHTSLDGSSLAQRVDRTGFKWSRIGENIAKGQQTPASVMKAWMNSPGHRANILNCQFKVIGVGLALDGKAKVWTQNFATPR